MIEARFAQFLESHPGWTRTAVLDELRAADYARLDQQAHVYLDYTGGGLYGQSQVTEHAAFMAEGVFGNPHSGNPASLKMTEYVEEARAAVLGFFNASPEDYSVIFTPNASGTWVDKLNNFFDPSDSTLVDPELGELQRPEWAGRASITADYNAFSLTWSTTYLDRMGLRAVEIEDVGNTGEDTFSFANGLTREAFIHDIAFSYEASDMLTVYGGVNNVLNRKPFVTEQAYPVSPVGTLFFLGATVSM